MAKALLVQILLALLLLFVPFTEKLISIVSQVFVKIISFSNAGSKFLFQSFNSGKINSDFINFVTQVLPTIIFFSAISGVLFYIGCLPKVVELLAKIMRKFIRISGAESLAITANIFLGQTEAPLLVKPYLKDMTKSELNTLMTSGMATVAGGVMAAYIGFLGGDNPDEQAFFAKHLLIASLLSAPASVLFAKMLYPEYEMVHASHKPTKINYGQSILESLTFGTKDGLKLAVNVAAMLLVFISLMALGNYVLAQGLGEPLRLNSWISENTNYDQFDLKFII